MIGCNDLLSAFDVERTATEALLFHTGYLTIRETKRRGGETDYRLGYPNRGWCAQVAFQAERAEN